MENFIATLNVVGPIAIMLAIGFFIRKINLLNSATSLTLNKLTFMIFMPAVMFRTISTSELEGVINVKLITFALLITVTIFLFLMLFIPRIEKDNPKRGVLIQGLLRSNFGVFGLSIALALSPDGNIGPIPIMIALTVPLYNALSVVALEIYSNKKVKISRILKSIITNPLIVSAMVGLLFLLLPINLPTVIDNSIEQLASIATPIALISLGASFSFSNLSIYKKQICIGVIGKLVVIPLILLPISILLGFRGMDLICLLIMFGAPPAASTFTVAEQMGGDATLAGQLVVLCSVGSVVTIFSFIYIFKHFALIY